MSPGALVFRVLFLGTLGLGACTSLVGRSFTWHETARYAAGALAVWLVVVVIFSRLYRREGAPVLGAATAVTLGRGALLSALAGFVLLPSAGLAGALAWVPGLLYTAAALSDLLDGYLARRWGQESALGAALDVALDALGLLVGPVVAVALGKLPPWYLLVGATYYLFHGGLWLRGRLGLPVTLERLRPSRLTRMYAGYQMGLVATVLFPVVGPPGTWIAATAFMAPNLTLFARDWLVTTGRLDPAHAPRYQRLVAMGGAVLRNLLPVFRLATAGGLLALVLAGWASSWLGLAAVLLVAGVAPRWVAFAAGVLLCLPSVDVLAPPVLATYLGVLLVLLAGGGRYSLWGIEDKWLLRRAGEAPSVSPGEA